MDARTHTVATHLHPDQVAAYLPRQYHYALFLDIDGTLAEFTLDPKDTVIPVATLTLLEQIRRYDVEIAIVTGRSLAEAKRMLSPLQLPIAATHGLEIDFNLSNLSLEQDIAAIGHGSIECISPNHINTTQLDDIKHALIDACLPYPDLRIELKPYSCAVHYRQYPTLATVACSVMSTVLTDYPDWALKQGKYVYEAVPKGVNKGTAILTLLKAMPYHDDMCAIFIGDDITDEAGFSAIQDHKLSIGMGIKVGSQSTCANYYVNNIKDVSALLTHFLALVKESNLQSRMSTSVVSTDSPPIKTQRDL